MDIIELKLEFGRFEEKFARRRKISDTCRFWDANSGEKLDKDRFRRDLGQVMEAYREVLRRQKE